MGKYRDPKGGIWAEEDKQPTLEERVATLEAGGGGESGGGGVLIVHADENGVLDKTWKEIHDAGVCFLAVESSNGGLTITRYALIAEVATNGSIYGASVSQSQMYATDNENGYPAYYDSDDQGGVAN